MTMQTQRLLIVSFSMCALLLLPVLTYADEITVQLHGISEYSLLDFGTAYTYTWSGDVKYEGEVVGEYTGQLTKTTLRGSEGYAVQWDVVIFTPGAIGDLISIRTIHISTGPGLDVGMVIAASPEYSHLVGAEVIIDGIDATVTW